MTIFGKKTVLFPFELYQKDIDFLFNILTETNKKRFINLLNFNSFNDEFSYVLENIMKSNNEHETYILKNVQGKNSKNIGIFYIFKYNEHINQIIFIPDEEYLNGLSKYLDKNELSYLEDGLNIIKEKFNQIKRLEIRLLNEDKLMKKLVKKSGFKKEGILQSYYKNCTSYKDVVLFSYVKD